MVVAAEVAEIQMVAEEAEVVVVVLEEEDVDDQTIIITGMVERTTSLNNNRKLHSNKISRATTQTSRIESRISNLEFITRSTASDRLKFATDMLCSPIRLIRSFAFAFSATPRLLFLSYSKRSQDSSINCFDDEGK